jgi:hypothetical protein
MHSLKSYNDPLMKNISKWNSLGNKQLTISLFVGIILLLAICLPHSSSYSYAQQQLRGQLSPSAYVKITSPVMGQKVAVGNLTISGISSDRTTSDCTVYADWDDVKPYQRVMSNGSSGAKDDYSKWYFTYTPAYHSIINGTNELTAKISCLDSPLNQTKWFSVNVTGVVPTSTAAISNQTQANLTAATATTTTSSGSGPTYFVFPQPATKIKIYEKNYQTKNDGGSTNSQPALKALSISIDVAKDPIIHGNPQTITVTVSDSKTHGKIKGAHVEGTVHYPSGHIESFSGTTDQDGKFSHHWTISGNANTGKFGINVQVSAKGYQAASKTSSFTVKSKSSSSQLTNNLKSLNTQPEATKKDKSDNDTSGGTNEETNTVANDNNNGIASTDTKDHDKDADQNSNTDTDKASKIVTATGVDTKNDGHTKVDGKPEDQDKAKVLDDHNDKKKKDDNSKATDDSDTHDKVKSKPESDNHDDNGGDKIKTTHEHKKSADKKPDNKPKEDSDKK